MPDAAGGQRRAALYVDFDNVFASLAALDEWAAWQFASAPGRWLAWLAAGGPDQVARRLLLRRCYLNPAGWTEPAPGGDLAAWIGQPRIYYSRFRTEFVRAGFEVVDCPRLARLKNAADIVMALDMADALAHPTRFEEFVVFSGDSDFTPLLHRLRAHDRRTLLVSPGMAAQALQAAADLVVALPDFADAALAPPEATPDPMPGPRPFPPPAAERAPAAEPPAAEAGSDPGEPAAQRAAILAAVRAALEAASGPLHLPGLGHRLHRELGGWVRSGRFGGAGSLAKLLEEAPELAVEAGPGGGWLYDPARHERPSASQPDLGEDPLGPVLGPLRAALGPTVPLPWLDAEALDAALHGLAALLPLAGPPEPPQRAALAAEAMAAGLDLPERALDALVHWLNRARIDWRAEPGAEARDRLARALFAELTRAAAAAGTRLGEDTVAALRDWAGLGRREAGEAPAPTGG